MDLHKNNPLFYFVATGLTTKIYYADDPISRTCKWPLNIFYSKQLKTKSPPSINYLNMYNIYVNGRSVDQVLNLILSEHFFFFGTHATKPHYCYYYFFTNLTKQYHYL